MQGHPAGRPTDARIIRGQALTASRKFRAANAKRAGRRCAPPAGTEEGDPPLRLLQYGHPPDDLGLGRLDLDEVETRADPAVFGIGAVPQERLLTRVPVLVQEGLHQASLEIVNRYPHAAGLGEREAQQGFGIERIGRSLAVDVVAPLPAL